jgi:hypothetical protein
MLHLVTCCRRQDSNMFRMEINKLGSGRWISSLDAANFGFP